MSGTITPMKRVNQIGAALDQHGLNQADAHWNINDEINATINGIPVSYQLEVKPALTLVTELRIPGDTTPQRRIRVKHRSVTGVARDVVETMGRLEACA